MQYILVFFLINLAIHMSVAPPVKQNNKEEAHEDDENDAGIMEYRRYLKEVVQALESDPDFLSKLEKADEADIRTGKIADQLEFVNHNVRTKLDELKREELERLRHLATKENQLMNGLDLDHLKIAEHLDHTNTLTFEVRDLKKLIAKTTKDLAEADRKRREEFKEQEMQRKYEEQEKLKSMDEAERKKYEEELEAMKEKHKKHEPVHHPGSKQQLEEVWEKQDHMDSEDFNIKTFFFMHDVDSNGVWDQNEVKALFLKEVDKLYAQGTAASDLLKRAEEMERMREHMFNEVDLDKDGLISYEEFFEQTKKPTFQQDEGWKGLDEKQIFTQEEFKEFIRHKQEELQRTIAKGMPPPHPGNIPVHHDSFPPQYVNVPVPQNDLHQQQYQGQHHDQYQHQQVPQQQYQHQQIPQQQYQHQQIPQQQYQHQQIPQQQYQQHHVPLQQVHGQMQQQQFHPQFQGQVPEQQFHHGQMPPQQQHYQDQMKQQQQQQQQPQQQHQPQQNQAGAAQVPVERQPQVDAMQQQQTMHQQNNLNQSPQNAQGNAIPQPNLQNTGQQQQQQQQQQNSQPAQVPVQSQEIHRNQIHTAEKV